MFLPDKAITQETEDLLNRSKFAHRLAETIRDWKKEESIVIGLYGPWGSGKSSIINLTIKHLIELTKNWSPENKPIVIWFNPWNFIEKDQLLRAFFQQLLSEIGKVVPDRLNDFKKGLESFGKALGALEKIPKVGEYFGMGGKVIGLFTNGKSLKDEKESLDKLFKNLDRRIVIIVDDIDRLTDEEIRLLFQIIKTNADFPNTIYLAAFDREVVQKALTNDRGIEGREYLEKIVQVGFNVPLADQGLIQRYLFAELDKVLTDIDEKDFDKDRWFQLFHHGFKDLFKSIRDVKRYINSLGVILHAIQLEINPIDYIGLEALRVFLPCVYQRIAENKSLILRESLLADRQEPKHLEIKKELDQIFSADGESFAKIARDISLQLFPQLNQIYSIYSAGTGWNQKWRKDKRICSEKFFDTYFLLGAPDGEVSQVEIDMIIRKAAVAGDIFNYFDPYIKDSRIRELINGLNDRAEDLSTTQCKNLIPILFKLLNSLPDLRGPIFDRGSDLDLLLVIKQLLLKLDGEERFEILRNQLMNKASLFASVSIVDFDLPRANEPRPEPIFSEEDLGVLKQLCVEQIEQKSEDRSIITEKRLDFILARWKSWTANHEKIDDFTKRIRSTPATFLDFLKGFISESRMQNSDSYQIEVKKGINFSNLSLFMNNEEINTAFEMVRGIDLNTLSHEQREVLDLLKEGLETENQKSKTQE